jgi:hypothetical protein
MRLLSLFALLFALSVGVAWADENGSSGSAPAPQASGGPEGHGHHHGPPPEAIDACKGKAADADCSFTGHHGDSVSGKCWSPDASKPLACKPAGMHPHGGGQGMSSGATPPAGH